jgi:hypothetical protein
MRGAVRLTLLIGPAVPVPAPPDVIDALDAVEVRSSTRTGGFQLTFKLARTSSVQTTLLPAGYFDPIVTRVVIIVTVRGLPIVLMDGVVVRHEYAPSTDAGKTTLTVTGEDLTRMMDLVDAPFMRYPGLSIVARVHAVLAKYAAFGIAPVAVPPVVPDISNPLEQVPTQIGTDLFYLRHLAAQVGYVFYVEPGPAPGSSIAYFGPPIRIPLPQPALSVNMDAATNVESLVFTLDGTEKRLLIVNILDPVSKRVPIAVPVPDTQVLSPPLSARPTVPSRVEFARDMAAFGPAEAANLAVAMQLESSDSVTATGSLDVLRYGHVLRSRMLVGVRGAGLAYDGLYYVASVTHSLRQGEYKQRFNLSRDGLVANTPRVIT